MGVVNRARRNAQVLQTGLADLSLGVGQVVRGDIQPRCSQCALAVVELRGVQSQFARGVDRAAVARDAVVHHLHIALAGNGATVVQSTAFSVDREVLAGSARADGSAVGEQAIGRELHLPGTGSDGAGVAHAHPRFRTDQTDLACVHASKLAYVKCKLRLRAGGCMHGLHIHAAALASSGGHRVIAQNQTELLGPDAGIDLRCTRQDPRVIHQRGIQALAVDGDGAALHPIAIEATAHAHLRRAGREDGAAGIDEAPAIHIDARGVGNDQFCALPSDFQIALDLARVGTVHLIEDDARLTACQPRIALNPATLLALHVAAAVVQDRARLVHVELAVGVTAHPRCTGRLDVDHRHAIGRCQYRGPLGAWSRRVRHDLRMGHLADQRAQGQADDAQQRVAHHLARSVSTILTPCAGDLGDRHVLTTGLVEDDAIVLLIHFKSI